MPAHVLILGGGFAGLRAAVSLIDAGLRVTVVESRVGLGGRARSFTDPATGEIVDNGQHLLLAGYERTLVFLRRLGTEKHVTFQPRLRVRFIKDCASYLLDCPPLPSPWHLVAGLWRFPLLSVSDRLHFARIVREVSRPASAADDLETVDHWLDRMGQSEMARNGFWRPLTVAALNEEPSRASAAGLKSVLRVMLKKSSRLSRLGLSHVGLSDLFARPAQEWIQRAGGVVLLNRPAVGFLVEGDRVRGVRFADGHAMEADAVISALPPTVLRKMVPESQAPDLADRLSRFRMSPILSVNLWFDRPFAGEEFTALVGNRYQWVFNKKNFISLIISAAYEQLDRPNEELVGWAQQEVRTCFPEMREARLLRSQVVREREATVSLGAGMERFRPGPRCELKNLFLAGDWTATGLPATIESAVVSGERAAEAVLEILRKIR